jgi:hypothetical protein
MANSSNFDFMYMEAIFLNFSIENEALLSSCDTRNLEVQLQIVH